MTKRQYTLWVDGKLRTYDHPPDSGYDVGQVLYRQWLQELRDKQRTEKSQEQPNDQRNGA